MKVKVLHRPLGPKKRMSRPDSPNAECWRTYINTVFYFQFPFNGRPTGHWTDWPTPNREFKNYSKMLYGTTSMTSFQSIFQLSTASFSLVHITVLLQIFHDITKQFSEILESSKSKWWNNNSTMLRVESCAYLKAMKDHNYLIICHRLHDSNFLSHVSNHQNCFGCPRAVCAKRRLHIFSRWEPCVGRRDSHWM